jgi:hypothetical protein
MKKLWHCEVVPSVTGGEWGYYGYANWPSYSTWLVPGTLNMDKE